MKEAVIVAAARTAVGKSGKGSLRTTRPDDLAALVIQDVLKQAPAVDASQIEDVILGCAMPEAEQGMNVARIAAMRAGLPHDVAGQTVNRFCSSGLQTIAIASQQIMAGMGKAILAGGVESMSMVPMSSNKFMANPWLASNHPAAYTSMGITAENVARDFKISRADQDAFALRSNQRAVAAIQAGKFKDEVTPVPVEISEVEIGSGKRVTRSYIFDTDEGPRADTTLEALAKLRPVFHVKGTVTAGNSSQTSDGAAVVLVMEREEALRLGLKPLVRFVGFAVGGVPPEVMGIGPIAAIPKVLKLTGLNLGDIDLIELNEAFAAQSLAVVRELGLDESKVNVNGGAIALGHPLGCSGAKLTVQIIHEMKRRGSRYGMVTMCIGGGMGAAGIFENLQ
ncbi:acetyl-CoA C-acyltransferase [Candidatus Amarolinea aalborgensis]|uniref:acetyl-CoA C-acyltransferase n=1 Tax=Candidatus Amarolinea aalborgensis TaxID=2249329 RepID=UPI003BF9A357